MLELWLPSTCCTAAAPYFWHHMLVSSHYFTIMSLLHYLEPFTNHPNKSYDSTSLMSSVTAGN
jgi:hypothetical protein